MRREILPGILDLGFFELGLFFAEVPIGALAETDVGEAHLDFGFADAPVFGHAVDEEGE